MKTIWSTNVNITFAQITTTFQSRTTAHYNSDLICKENAGHGLTVTNQLQEKFSNR